MLKDRFFYPLALTFIAAMIWFALSRSTAIKLTTACIQQNGFITQGVDLLTLTASPGTNYEYIGATPSNPAYVVAMTEIPRKNAQTSAGVFAALGPDYERAFAGQNIRMTVRARQGRKNPLKDFDMGYFAGGGAGDTVWLRRVLSSDWQNYVLDFKPNPIIGDPDVDYLGVWPGDKGKQETMDIEFIKVELISRPSSVDTECPAA